MANLKIKYGEKTLPTKIDNGALYVKTKTIEGEKKAELYVDLDNNRHIISDGCTYSDIDAAASAIYKQTQEVSTLRYDVEEWCNKIGLPQGWFIEGGWPIEYKKSKDYSYRYWGDDETSALNNAIIYLLYLINAYEGYSKIKHGTHLIFTIQKTPGVYENVEWVYFSKDKDSDDLSGDNWLKVYTGAATPSQDGYMSKADKAKLDGFSNAGIEKQTLKVKSLGSDVDLAISGVTTEESKVTLKAGDGIVLSSPDESNFTISTVTNEKNYTGSLEILSIDTVQIILGERVIGLEDGDLLSVNCVRIDSSFNGQGLFIVEVVQPDGKTVINNLPLRFNDFNRLPPNFFKVGWSYLIKIKKIYDKELNQYKLIGNITPNNHNHLPPFTHLLLEDSTSPGIDFTVNGEDLGGIQIKQSCNLLTRYDSNNEHYIIHDDSTIQAGVFIIAQELDPAKPISFKVTFPKPFRETSTPVVLVTPMTGAPSSVHVSITPNSINSDGFGVHISREDNNLVPDNEQFIGTPVEWIAIQYPNEEEESIENENLYNGE